MKIKFIRGVKTYHRKILRQNKLCKEWSQFLVADKTIREKLTTMVGYKGSKPVTVVLHCVYSSVDWHTDNMSKSCYLIPIECFSGWTLKVQKYVKDRKTELKVGEAYKFSDFDEHGLFRSDTTKGRAIFYTLSVNPY